MRRLIIMALLLTAPSLLAMQRFSFLAKNSSLSAVNAVHCMQFNHLNARLYSTYNSTDLKDSESTSRIEWLKEKKEKDETELKKLIEQRNILAAKYRGRVAGSLYKASLIGGPLSVFSIHEPQPQMSVGAIVFMATGIRILEELKKDEKYLFDCAVMNREFKFFDTNIRRLWLEMSEATTDIERAIKSEKKEKYKNNQ